MDLGTRGRVGAEAGLPRLVERDTRAPGGSEKLGESACTSAPPPTLCLIPPEPRTQEGDSLKGQRLLRKGEWGDVGADPQNHWPGEGRG